LCAESWNAFSDNRPDEFKSDAEVLVNYNVAEGDDLRPRNPGVRFSKLIRDAAAGFP